MAESERYYVGETIRAGFAIEVANDLQRVIALFQHESKPDRIIRLVGSTVEQRVGAEYGGSYLFVRLEGDAPAGTALGLYRCVSLIAEYRNREKHPFKRLPHQTFEIEQRHGYVPTGMTWEWQ